MLGAALWILLLRIYPLSVAFPIASGMLMLGTTFIGYFYLNESLPLTHLVGTILILSGITLISIAAK